MMKAGVEGTHPRQPMMKIVYGFVSRHFYPTDTQPALYSPSNASSTFFYLFFLPSWGAAHVSLGLPALQLIYRLYIISI